MTRYQQHKQRIVVLMQAWCTILVALMWRVVGRRRVLPANVGMPPSEIAAAVTPRRRPVPRRMQLVQLLGRIDNGTRHYGSKRKDSQHRGSGYGKRSGRQ